MLYPHSHADSDLPGERREGARTSLQNSTGSSHLRLEVLGSAGRQTPGLPGSFLGLPSASAGVVGFGCVTPRRMPRPVPSRFAACRSNFLVFRWSGARCTLGKMSAGAVKLFMPLVVRAASRFLFSFKTAAKQDFLPLLLCLLFVEGLGISCFQSETILLSARQAISLSETHTQFYYSLETQLMVI